MDNCSVVNSCSILDSRLQKKHVAICYHVVRKAVAVGMKRVAWISSDSNYADLFTKTIDHKRRMFDELLYCDRSLKKRKADD